MQPKLLSKGDQSYTTLDIGLSITMWACNWLVSITGLILSDIIDLDSERFILDHFIKLRYFLGLLFASRE